ncbi:MAG: Ig-like domain-containing protein [Acidobacteriota bacterium]
MARRTRLALSPARPILARPLLFVLRNSALIALLAFGLSLLGAPPLAAQISGGAFPNVSQTPGDLLSGLNAPQQGRTAIIAYHNGVLFTVPELPSSAPNSDFLVRTWDLSNLANPVETGQHGVSPMPINAHGYFKSGDYLVLGSNWPPEAPWSFRATSPETVERTTFPDHWGAGVRGQLFQPWFAGQTYWSYGAVGGNATLELRGVELASWDHLGLTGVVGHPFLLGDLLIFASDQSRTGVATYDVSDPTNPVLLDVLSTGGAGGYWPEIWGGDGKLYLVFPYRTGGNGFRVVDATDPSDLKFVIDRPLPGTSAMYAQFQDEYAFIGDHKIDMRSLESVLFLDGANVTRTNDGGTGVDTSQFALPLGNLLITGGIGDDQGMAIWAHQAAPDTRGPSVGFHIPQAGRTNYPVGAPISLLIHETLETSTLVNGTTFIVRPLGGAAVAGRITYSFDDVLTFTPDQPLQQNTTYEVVLPAGGIEDAAGNGMVGYSFTFSTGSMVGGNQAPEVQSFTASAYPAAPGASVTLSASAVDPDVEAVEYRFDFGDGSPRTAWSSTGSTSHSWADAGHYRATVQARDAAGAIATAQTTVTVLSAPAGPFPSAGGSLVCDDGSRRLWTANPDNDSITSFDLDSLAKLAEVPVCDDPRALGRSALGEIWVACRDDDRVQVLDSGGTLVDEVQMAYGAGPAGLAVSPDGQWIYVALEGSGSLARFNAGTRAAAGELLLGPSPRAVAVSADGSRVYVTRFLSPKHHGEVWEVDTGTLTLARKLEIPKFGGEAHRDGTAEGRGVANYLTSVALSPDGARLWVTANKPNFERGLTFFHDLDTDNTVRNLLVGIGISSGEVEISIDLDNSDSASALAFSPLGDYLFVTLQGSDEVVVVDALAVDEVSGFGSVVTRLATGSAPQGICVDPTTQRTLVKDFLSRSVTSLETQALFTTGGKTVPSASHSAVSSETLAAAVLNGKRIFYHASDPRMSAEGYLSCATCHLDGAHDGRVWDFTGRGEGLRNTTTLLGRGGIAQGNVHWTANFDEIQDFENDIRGPFGGSGFLDDGDFAVTEAPLGPAKAGLNQDLDDLALYVASLNRASLPRSPHRNPDGSLTNAALAGRSLFRSLGCHRCHAGEQFTDSALGPTPKLHDVGTLRSTSGSRLGGALQGIDTPSLLGLWNGAPFLHDGSAATLEEVFQVAGGTLYLAEDGTPSGGGNTVAQWVELNNDDTVRGRAYVELQGIGAQLTLNNLEGGDGGLGALELRYSNAGFHPLEVIVNGFSQIVQLPDAGNDPTWRHTNWNTVRVEDVQLQAGATNTVELVSTISWPNATIDDVIVTPPRLRNLADPHRRALALSPQEFSELLAYLRQLDGTPEANPDPRLFSGGFESGGTGEWSRVVGGG